MMAGDCDGDHRYRNGCNWGVLRETYGRTEADGAKPLIKRRMSVAFVRPNCNKSLLTQII